MGLPSSKHLYSNVRAPSFKLANVRAFQLKRGVVRGQASSSPVLRLREIALRVASRTHHNAYASRTRLPAVQGLRGEMGPCTSAARAEARVVGNSPC